MKLLKQFIFFSYRGGGCLFRPYFGLNIMVVLYLPAVCYWIFDQSNIPRINLKTKLLLIF